ncbi:LysM peptidoglycan-binding domain-containing protein [Phytohabitans kaempferiae]|uniref:LysM peptidoglycan-binding domain-containing protein n=1 Tax=Phytohabitans kaempferiae TaxID=1620943 RepID=A0ABV6M9I3_9ACTN
MHAMGAQAAVSAGSAGGASGVTSVLAVASAAGVVVPARGGWVRADTRPAVKPRLRLTRRGRVVVFIFFLLLAATVVTLAATASRAADPPGAAPTTVVQRGDTLWSLVDRHDLRGNRIAVIEEIRRLNALDGYTVYAGQELKLPR